jgi:hypothetical protein
MTEHLLTSRDLSQRWNLSIRTIEKWRYVDFGPPFLKFGKAIRYRIEDIIEFEQRALKKESATHRKFREAERDAEVLLAEEAPLPRLSVRDVVMSVRRDM